MILQISELKENDKFKNIADDILERKLIAIEHAIRAYTNNNFQNRKVRFEASSEERILKGISPYLRVDDTVQISKSVNEGLYVVTEISDTTTLNKEMFNAKYNLVTKIEYPYDVKEGVVNLMLWEIEGRDKMGIKSETISRHSVTYADIDVKTGYPTALLGFLTPYVRANI